MSGANMNAVFYADKYHPIQAGSIDGTDVAPHDNAVLRAHICSQAGLYDPFSDPKATGDPYCTVFVGHLSRQTDEETLRKAMSRYGRVKSMRLVRDIVTGASRGYAFVEYETDREMRRAYEDAHHSIIDGSQVLVDYYRQQLMPGWIPRRLGGGLGGKKESGQLRFGGRERPFRAPLRPIPYDELKKLGIPPPPEGRYMTRFQVPPPPRRESSNVDREDSPPGGRSRDRVDDSSHRRQRSPTEDDDRGRRSRDRVDHSSHRRQRRPTEDDGRGRRSRDRVDHSSHRRQRSPTEDDGRGRRSWDRVDDSSHKRQRSPTEDDGQRRKLGHDQREESQSRRSERSSLTSEEMRYSRHRQTGEDDDARHRKRRRSREPGELSPAEEDGGYSRERTSTEVGHSPDQHRHYRHHREHRHESSHSRHRDSWRHSHHGYSKRSENGDYSS